MELSNLIIIQRLSFMIGGIFYLIGWLYSLIDSSLKSSFMFFIIILFFSPSSLIYLLYCISNKRKNSVKVFFIFFLALVLLIFSLFLQRYINEMDKGSVL